MIIISLYRFRLWLNLKCGSVSVSGECECEFGMHPLSSHISFKSTLTSTSLSSSTSSRSTVVTSATASFSASVDSIGTSLTRYFRCFSLNINTYTHIYTHQTRTPSTSSLSTVVTSPTATFSASVNSIWPRTYTDTLIKHAHNFTTVVFLMFLYFNMYASIYIHTLLPFKPINCGDMITHIFLPLTRTYTCTLTCFIKLALTNNFVFTHSSAASAASTTGSGESYVPPSNEVYEVILPPVFVQVNAEEVRYEVFFCWCLRVRVCV